MNTGRKELATKAVAQALRVRKRLRIPIEHAVCALDAAERLNVEARFVDLPSMEGIYLGGSEPTILLSILRPPGRRNFTCAHEIGHHVFEHGERFDELMTDRTAARKDDPDEFLADAFAACFLMPKATVEHAMHIRNYRYQELAPLQVYALASWLGVGYETLVLHMRYGLNTILHLQMQELLRYKPKSIREQVLGRPVTSHMHLVDSFWTGRAIDAEVGDYIVTTKSVAADGHQLAKPETLGARNAFHVVKPGLTRLADNESDWSAFVRVSKKDFIGRACFRFEEEVD